MKPAVGAVGCAAPAGDERLVGAAREVDRVAAADPADKSEAGNVEYEDVPTEFEVLGVDFGTPAAAWFAATATAEPAAAATAETAAAATADTATAAAAESAAPDRDGAEEFELTVCFQDGQKREMTRTQARSFVRSTFLSCESWCPLSSRYNARGTPNTGDSTISQTQSGSNSRARTARKWVVTPTSAAPRHNYLKLPNVRPPRGIGCPERTRDGDGADNGDGPGEEDGRGRQGGRGSARGGGRQWCRWG